MRFRINPRNGVDWVDESPEGFSGEVVDAASYDAVVAERDRLQAVLTPERYNPNTFEGVLCTACNGAMDDHRLNCPVEAYQINQLFNERDTLTARIAELEGEIQAREERRATVLEWIEDKIGTGYMCVCCGRSEYNTMPLCQECGTDAPLLHLIAFKLHATHNEPKEPNEES